MGTSGAGCEYLNASSNCLPGSMHTDIGCICLTYLHPMVFLLSCVRGYCPYILFISAVHRQLFWQEIPEKHFLLKLYKAKIVWVLVKLTFLFNREIFPLFWSYFEKDASTNWVLLKSYKNIYVIPLIAFSAPSSGKFFHFVWSWPGHLYMLTLTVRPV